MSIDVELLHWDSDFFGMNVGRITGDITDKQDLYKAIEGLQKLSIDLGYYTSLTPLKALQSAQDFEYNFYLVDKKITYLKSLRKNAIFNNSIIAFEENYPNDQLLHLAIESGVYSRFNVDKKVGRNKYEELYKEWIINSVNKKIAKEVLIYKENKTIAGLVTLADKNLIADIGIIAVDKQYRGKGIGKFLIYAAENWFAQNNYDQIRIVTQQENLPACRLYERCGYKISKVEYTYHAWKNNNK